MLLRPCENRPPADLETLQELARELGYECRFLDGGGRPQPGLEAVR